MVVIGGRAGLDITGTVEVFDPLDDSWQTVPELALREPRYSFCAVPGKTSLSSLVGNKKNCPDTSPPSEFQRTHGDRRLGRVGGPVQRGGAGRGDRSVAARPVPPRPQLRPRLSQDRAERPRGGACHWRGSDRSTLTFSL
jgi:hypothetical protein